VTDLAVVNYGPGQVELRPAEPPPLGPHDVLLEVQAVSVCGSDVHQWHGQMSWNVTYPVVLGHEFTGIIAAVGVSVSDWKVGDRVVSETAAQVDMSTPLSRVGLYNLCPSRSGFGAVINGAMAKYVRTPARCLHRVPESISPEIASLTEPCCVAYNAVVNNGNVRPGDRIVVLGPGPIGILAGAMARIQGGEVAIVGLERDATRLEVARQMGLHPIVGDATEWAYAVDGLGADGVIDAAGVSATVKTAIELVRPAGWVSKVGWGAGEFPLSLDPLVQKNVTLRGSFSHNYPVWERVLRLLDTGALDVRPLIGGVWPLEEWMEGFEGMHNGSIVKAVLKP
jgi:alcohol dehydrogenase/L-iditol 2-dehydrogenase